MEEPVHVLNANFHVGHSMIGDQDMWHRPQNASIFAAVVDTLTGD